MKLKDYPNIRRGVVDALVDRVKKDLEQGNIRKKAIFMVESHEITDSLLNSGDTFSFRFDYIVSHKELLEAIEKDK